MLEEQPTLLIVDDEPSMRTSLSMLFDQCGYRVRTACDGVTALLQIREQAPNILLSDLNMPGMSGFELLSIARRRFPSMRVIAMSGAFSGSSIPAGVSADAFYEKGSSPRLLIQVIRNLVQSPRSLPLYAQASEPIWVSSGGHGHSGHSHITVTCPDCLRTSSVILERSACSVLESTCTYCLSPIHSKIVELADHLIQQPRKTNLAVDGEMPFPHSGPTNENERVPLAQNH